MGLTRSRRSLHRVPREGAGSIGLHPFRFVFRVTWYRGGSFPSELCPLPYLPTYLPTYRLHHLTFIFYSTIINSIDERAVCYTSRWYLPALRATPARQVLAARVCFPGDTVPGEAVQACHLFLVEPIFYECTLQKRETMWWGWKGYGHERWWQGLNVGSEIIYVERERGQLFGWKQPLHCHGYLRIVANPRTRTFNVTRAVKLWSPLI